jgi:hypothetical protein
VAMRSSPFVSTYAEWTLYVKTDKIPDFCSDRCFETALRKFQAESIDFRLYTRDEQHLGELYGKFIEKHLAAVRRCYPTFAEEEKEANSRTMTDLQDIFTRNERIFNDAADALFNRYQIEHGGGAGSTSKSGWLRNS